MIELFPDAPLSRMVAAYFALIGTPLQTDDEDEAERRPKKPVETEDDYVGVILVRLNI